MDANDVANGSASDQVDRPSSPPHTDVPLPEAKVPAVSPAVSNASTRSRRGQAVNPGPVEEEASKQAGKRKARNSKPSK